MLALTAAVAAKVDRCARQARATARVAIQLAREDAGQYMTVKELSDAAWLVVASAFAARVALDRGRDPETHYKAVRLLVAPFGVEVVSRGDLHGMVVGLRFHSGRFASGFDDTFYVT